MAGHHSGQRCVAGNAWRGQRNLTPGRYTVVVEVLGDESSENLRLTR